MRWRQVALLYVVLAALSAQYWFVERGRPAPDAVQEVVRNHLLDLDAEDVRTIRLQRGGRTLVMERTDERWAVVEPSGVTVPGDLVLAFVHALAVAEEIDQVAAPTEGLDAFGFGDTATRIDLGLTNDRTIVVTLGSTNPTGTALYARRSPSPTVVLIGRQVRYYEDLLFQALPAPRVPTGTDGRVGSGSPLTIDPGPV